MSSSSPSPENVHRPPVRFRRGRRDRHGPLPHHVPEGPSVPPLAAAEDLLTEAVAWARADAKAGVHDAVSLEHEPRMLFDRDNDAQRRQDEEVIDALELDDLSMNDAIRAGAQVDIAAATARLALVDADLAALDATVEDGEDELLGRAPYEDSVWQAPERVTEPVGQTLVRRWGVNAGLVGGELSINFLALQLLPGGWVERLSFAVVVGLSTVWAGHAAGVWLAEHRRADLRVRALVPAAFALLVLAVTALMAALRVAYVDRSPGPDVLTGEPMPSALADSGIPGLVVWGGIAAVQLIFFVVTVLHTLTVHNPRVRALQTARAQRTRGLRRRAALVEELEAAQERGRLADAHVERTRAWWTGQRAARAALYEQRFVRYGGELARALGDPEVTVALEARHARDDRPRDVGAEPTDRATTPLTVVPDAPQHDDPDTDPPDDDPSASPGRPA